MSSQPPKYGLPALDDVEQKCWQQFTDATTHVYAAPITALVDARSQAVGRRQKVTLNVRPAAWGIWTFYQMWKKISVSSSRTNPLLKALAQSVAQRGQTKSAGQQNRLLGTQFQ